MRAPTLFKILFLVLVLLQPLCCPAQGGWQSNGIGGVYGTGKDTGSGWQSNGIGGVYGTGNNAGSGWQSNGMGGYFGTGRNAGRHCQPNGIGGLNCY